MTVQVQRRTFPMMQTLRLVDGSIMEARKDSQRFWTSTHGVNVNGGKQTTLYPWSQVKSLSTYRSPRAVMVDE